MAVVRNAVVDFLAAAVFFLTMIAYLVALGMLVGNGGGGALGDGAAAGSATGGGESAVVIPLTSLVTGIAVVLGLLGAFGAAERLGDDLLTHLVQNRATHFAWFSNVQTALCHSRLL